jgi:hypothetical protein
MLQACANPDCSVHFTIDAEACPICGTLAMPTGQNTASTPTIPAAGDGKMTDEECRGKYLLTALLLVMILIDVTVVLLAMTAPETSVILQVLRLAFTLLLCSEMYHGSIAAGRVTVALGLFGGVWLFFTILEERKSIDTMIGVAFLIFLVAFTTTLVSSRRINAFMAYQRRKELALIQSLESPKPTTGVNDQ